jgi:hypothetical protein
MIKQLLKNATIRKNNLLQILPITFINRPTISTSTVNCKKNVKVEANFTNEMIELHVNNEDDKTKNSTKSFEFPFVWLRDNCKVR